MNLPPPSSPRERLRRANYDLHMAIKHASDESLATLEGCGLVGVLEAATALVRGSARVLDTSVSVRVTTLLGMLRSMFSDGK